MILDIIETKKKIDEETMRMVKMVKEKYNKNVRLDVILASADEASKKYVKNKELLAKSLGIESYTHVFDKRFSSVSIIKKIRELNYDNNVNGVMVQSPVFNHLDEDVLMNEISKYKDVDGLSDTNTLNIHKNNTYGILCKDNFKLLPCTPYGIILYLTENKINLTNKNVVIIGRSKLVGEPLQKIIRDITNCNVTILHSKTGKANMMKYFNIADVIISAVGKDSFTITKDMFKSNKKVTIFDIGIKFDNNGKMMGDCDRELYDDEYITVTRTPKGTAQLTLSALMRNTVLAAVYQYENHIK